MPLIVNLPWYNFGQITIKPMRLKYLRLQGEDLL